MKRARGASTLGCLFTLIVIGAIVYFGINIGRVYWRYYEYLDDMKTEARFAGTHTNDQILFHLRASSDSLGLPEAAGKISIRRNDKGIALESEYYENIEFPMYVKEVRFHPHAEASF